MRADNRFKGNIMIQGTMSNVGKSLLCAALCRVLKQDGFRCVPFKSQNMALNSGVTVDGLEMGRAQILQAQAAGVEPDVRMNPILLKPSSDTGSQVIVNGRVIGHLSAREYMSGKRRLIPQIMEAYESLAKEADVVVIEGAGSPAEINLRKDDIVNMGLAEMVDAPVLLAGDIDPGGVFAQLYGTVKLLSLREQKRVRGLIINKFRGDPTLLDPGISMLEEMLGIPVTGVIPYMNIELEDEDSMSGSLLIRRHNKPVDIAVIRFPKISNFTDLDPLISHPVLGVRYVQDKNELGAPDMIILPGTKSTLADLRWLRETALADLILREAGMGTYILGICGGYQMLGEMLADPEGTEGEGSGVSLPGLGLLPVRTAFGSRKVRRRVRGNVHGGIFDGVYVYGYEIHMGRTAEGDMGGHTAGHTAKTAESAEGGCGTAENDLSDVPLSELVYGNLTDSSGIVDMCCRGHVCGTYLHGLFDSGEAVDRLAEVLARRKGIAGGFRKTPDRRIERERQFDMLADTFRSCADMDKIYRILERRD